VKNIGEHWGTLGNIEGHWGTLGSIEEHWGTLGEHAAFPIMQER